MFLGGENSIMKRLAVHLHLYYIEQLEEILKKLRNLRGVEYDLFITMVIDDEDIRKRVLDVYPLAKIWVVENRGYDVGPFIDFLHKINLDEYVYVLKLHTKGKKNSNYTFIKNRRLDNSLWGKIMWDSLLKSQNRIEENLKILDEQEGVGMLGSAYCFSDEKRHYWHMIDDINIALKKIGFDKIDSLSFIAGCMFLCRAKLLKPLLVYSLNDFEKTNGKIKDETLAHVLERLFGVIVKLQGYNIFQINSGVYFLSFLKIVLMRFFIQKKRTKSGKTIIKVCKIPVYIKQMEV